MQLATISSKFQICIPKKVRNQLHIKPGQQFICLAKGDCLELVPKRNIEDFRGTLAGANTNDIRDRNDRV